MVESQSHHCHFHPDTETGVACNKCGKYICTRCMVQTDVGIRCKECAQIHRLPIFDIRIEHYLIAAAVGGAVAGAAGVIWGLLMQVFAGWFLLPWLLAIAVGFVVGEAVSLSVNRKRGPGLVGVALACMVVALITSTITMPFSLRFFFADPFRLLILIAAFITAAVRVR